MLYKVSEGIIITKRVCLYFENYVHIMNCNSMMFGMKTLSETINYGFRLCKKYTE